MAIVKYGTVVIELKGSVGGNVFQKCGQSLSMRTKSTQRVNQSNASFLTRNNMRVLSSTWRGLTVAQRNSFITNASTYPTYDSWHNPIILSGYQMYIYINRRMQLAGFALVSTCPVYAAAAGYISFRAIYHKTGANFNQTIAVAIPATVKLLVYISDALPVSTIHFPSNMRCIGSMSNLPVGVYNLFPLINAAFRVNPSIGQKFAYKVYAVNSVTGVVNFFDEDLIEVLA